jgi:hypothetical protein
MTITNLDFAELRRLDTPGYGLQALVAAIGRKLGFTVESGGRGADHGRDLFFQGSEEVIQGLSYPVKILVSCKDSAQERRRQLTVNDIAGFHGRVAEHGCNGFILVTTVPPTDGLVTHVRDTARNNSFQATIWQRDQLMGILLDQQDTIFRFTIARFFPNSSRAGDSNQQTFDYFAGALELLQKEDALSLSAEFIEEVDDLLLIWECAEKLMSLADTDFETDLQPHFTQILAKENTELTAAVVGALQDPVQIWINRKYDWDDVEVLHAEVRDRTIRIDVGGISDEETEYDSLKLNIRAMVDWNDDGFSLEKDAITKTARARDPDDFDEE